MSNFIPGPAVAQSPLGGEIQAFLEAVHAIVCEEGHPFSLPENSDRPHHAQEIGAKLISVCPVSLSGFIMSMASGDVGGALQAIRDGLTVLQQVDGNLFAIHGNNAKAMYRLALRRTLYDRESCDSMADYAGETEARKGAYSVCAAHGLDASTFVDEAVALDARIRQDKADAQHARDMKAAAGQMATRNPEHMEPVALQGRSPQLGGRRRT